MVIHSIDGENYAFTLARDGNLRVWCCSKAQCLFVYDVITEAGARNRTPGGKIFIQLFIKYFKFTKTFY